MVESVVASLSLLGLTALTERFSFCFFFFGSSSSDDEDEYVEEDDELQKDSHL